MNSLNWRPTLKYNLYQGLRSLAVFFAVIIAVMVVIPAILAISLGGKTEINFFGLGFGSGIMFFILGLLIVRENIKYFLQNGCGRPTLFISDIFACLLMAVLTALISELLLWLFGATYSALEMNVTPGEIFLFRRNGALPGGQGIMLSICGLILAWRVGMFISLVYYRLSRLWQVIISVAVPALLIFGLPFSAGSGIISPTLFTRGFHWLIASPQNAMLAALVTSLIFTLASWPLLKRAQVKE